MARVRVAAAPLPTEALEAHDPAAAARGRIALERWMARVLRTGAALSGGLFLGSVVMETLPQTAASAASIDELRKLAASVLLATPVARLALSGAALGARGEWRYAAAATAVLGLLALAVGTGYRG